MHYITFSSLNFYVCKFMVYTQAGQYCSFHNTTKPTQNNHCSCLSHSAYSTIISLEYTSIHFWFYRTAVPVYAGSICVYNSFRHICLHSKARDKKPIRIRIWTPEPLLQRLLLKPRLRRIFFTYFSENIKPVSDNIAWIISQSWQCRKCI